MRITNEGAIHEAALTRIAELELQLEEARRKPGAPANGLRYFSRLTTVGRLCSADETDDDHCHWACDIARSEKDATRLLRTGWSEITKEQFKKRTQ